MADKAPPSDDSYFSELLSQFGEAPPEAEDGGEELAAFLESVERGSKELEEAEVRSLLEGMPTLDEDGPLSRHPGVQRLVGVAAGDADPEAVDEILAAFSDLAGGEAHDLSIEGEGEPAGDPEPSPEVEEEPASVAAVEAPAAVAAEPPQVVAVEAPPAVTAAHPPAVAVLPERSRPAPVAAAPAPLAKPAAPPQPAPPRPRPAILGAEADPTAPAGFTLRDLFGFELSEDVPVLESSPDRHPFDDALAPRKAFATRRLHQFFLKYIGGRTKLAVIRYLMVTGLDLLTEDELEEVLIIPPGELAGPLQQMIRDGLLMDDRGRYSLNPRSRNVLLMASLVAGWQDPEHRAEIWSWMGDAQRS